MGKVNTERHGKRKEPPKVKRNKKFDAEFKAPKTGGRVGTRSTTKVSATEYRDAVELGNKQPTINMRGGVGIPGKRTKAAVQKFTALDFSNLKGELSPILDMSKTVREMRDKGEDIESIRKEVKKVNRKVVYKEGSSDVHSLHVGNDIAAVSNGRASKVYDYPDLAPKLDKRLANATSKGKTYWNSELSLDQRRFHVAEGLKHVVAGNMEKAQESFNKLGLTDKGQKWVNKMSTLMLAEQARALHGDNGKHVSDALSHVAGSGKKNSSKSFHDVFVKNAAALAPFAQRGGAKTMSSK